MWFAKYRFLFLAATIVFLGFAYYKAYRNRENPDPWSMPVLHGVTVFSLGMIAYTLIVN